MDHNPYTPPSATVQDVHLAQGQRGSRPAAVVVAVVLLALGLVYSGSGLFRMLAYINTGFMAPTFLVFTLARWIVIILMCIHLWRGRNWARIVLLVLTVFSLLTVFANVWSYLHAPAGIDMPTSASLLVSLLAAPLINLAAVFLVYVPGRRWFARRVERVG